MLCYRRKCTVSLCIFAENFYSASSLNTAESAQFYSTFLPITINLTPRFRRKYEVWLQFFAENAQNYPKTDSYEDNTKFHSAL